MKIYFAGSIRGGREDAALYGRIISFMKREHTVLTEHIGAPSIRAMGEEGVSDEDIYRQDMAWLRECDMVIAECSCPSLGVGYEMAFAEGLGKPVHIFFSRERGSLSAMLSGDSYFHIHYYSGEDELFRELEKLI